ncbi:ferredoxin-thioredoxin reductase catalytic domain-containing protein [Arcobacter sp. FWKO B]|uniref:ferredoxin-thioredoxin reductase catalytic domain-containing protein n=1 Tax=Arcobacter sp. FWKO B TaxID=2593672 RepID=UPI0018A539C4|nr:ferredoxin-thioredoxin reductase catalytic domain-containing protein [Arcobacter sp. FWKO B]QOG11616.1 sulfurtransferase [Arcobacter sp. FWKO B]
MIRIDTTSPEFLTELENTKKFTDKVCNQFGFVYNPQSEVNEAVTLGLTRNKLIYDKRFCPCFMVIGETKEEQKNGDNRICPCKPALTHEIPDEGKCHCGIFCTPEYAKNNAIMEVAEIAVHTHSRGLTKKECELLLEKESVDADELEALLEARELGMVYFNLVDVREWMEWKSRRIEGTDYLVPTTTFYNSISQLENQKDKINIVYCFSGSRSEYCQYVMKDLGFSKVINFDHGIMTYKGKVVSGEA